MSAKKQHFVPQLLLKKFAIEDGRRTSVGVYDIDRAQYRPKQNIRDVCARNYVYDTDASFEDFLSAHVEHPASSDIDRLARARKPLGSKPTEEFLRFLLVQLSRTRQSYESSLAFLNAGAQTMFSEMARLNGFDADAAKGAQMVPSEPRVLLAYSSALAAMNWSLISDLNLALVVNKTPIEFVLSDNPVFQHNWYLRGSTELGASSITARGAQFFMPLSPSVTCCLYDASVYLYGDAADGEIVEASDSDVHILNSFQAINAGSFMVARAPSMEMKLKELGVRYGGSRAFTEVATCVPATAQHDGTLRSLHVTERRQTELSAMPSFVKVKNKVRRRAIRCVERRPEFAAAHDARIARLIERGAA